MTDMDDSSEQTTPTGTGPALQGESGGAGVQAADAAAGTSPAGAAASGGGTANAETAALRAEVERLKDGWLRAKAETENFRKQAAIDREKTRKYAIETFAESLLPVKDSLEAALAGGNLEIDTLRSGVELTLRQLASAFEKAQIVEVQPVGERFDPHRHQAMSMVESDQAPNTVVQVFQKGYVLQDRVLRPAMVTVAKARDAA
jgi:molecular chaperone GrpE